MIEFMPDSISTQQSEQDNCILLFEIVSGTFVDFMLYSFISNLNVFDMHVCVTHAYYYMCYY